MGEMRLHRGTRQGFLLLVEHLRSLSRATGKTVSPPAALLVGSSTQRRLLLPRLARELGGAFLGIEVLTPAAFARRVLEHAGEEARLLDGEVAFRLLVRRAVRRTRRLARDVEAFADGPGLALAPVRDLLGAGLHPEAAAALLEELAEEPLPRPVRERARELVEVAVSVAAQMEHWSEDGRPHPLVRNAERIARATELLARPGTTLPFRAVTCWGLPDAPGGTAEMLAALLRLPGTAVFLDEPPDPARPTEPAPGEDFRRAFRETLAASATRVVPPPEDGPAPAVLDSFHAVGPDGEAREICRRILDLLARGTRPEEIAVVSRGLDEILPALAAAFDEEGIPWTLFAPVPVGLGPAERTAGSAARLLERGRDATVDDWLDARDLSPTRRAELALLMRSQGIVRLGLLERTEAGALPGRSQEVFLPVRVTAGERFVPRRLPREAVAREIEAARRFLHLLEQGPAPSSPAQGGRWLRDLLALLRQREFAPGISPDTVGVLLEQRLPPGLALEKEELLLVGAELLQEGARPAPGGRGGGVRVLGVLRARGIPFTHLFLAGMNRDVFPRVVRDDPLLPDLLRHRARDVLPALPLPLAGHDEERWLFAHLLAAADRVVLSWQRATADGLQRNPSPFVKGLELAGVLGPPEPVPETPRDPRTLDELAVAAGRATRGRLGKKKNADEMARALGTLLRAAAVRWGAEPGPGDPGRAARARVAVAALLEDVPGADRAARDLVLPWFGFVVPGELPGDGGPPWVTLLEQLARCPWQALLSRLLRIEPPPDAAGLPPVPDARLVGITVHRALARLLGRDHAGGSLAERVDDATPLLLPDDASRDRLLEETAREVLADEGVRGEAAVRALVRRARVPVAAALDGLEDAEGTALVGAELDGAAAGVRFRADLVLREGGALVLVDWKTGQPFTRAKQEQTRRRHFLAEVRRGHLLQAAVYAQYAAGGRPATGRYVYLPAEPGAERFEWTVDGEDTGTAAACAGAVRRWTSLARGGPFFPRLFPPGREGSEDRACLRCPWRDACIAGETDLSRRLGQLAEALATRPATGGEEDPLARFAACWAPPEAEGGTS